MTSLNSWTTQGINTRKTSSIFSLSWTDRIIRSLIGGMLLTLGTQEYPKKHAKKGLSLSEQIVGGVLLLESIFGFDPLVTIFRWTVQPHPSIKSLWTSNNLWKQLKASLPGQGYQPNTVTQPNPRSRHMYGTEPTVAESLAIS